MHRIERCAVFADCLPLEVSVVAPAVTPEEVAHSKQALGGQIVELIRTAPDGVQRATLKDDVGPGLQNTP